MSLRHTLPLAGCAPVPLAHYLKALAALRLVSEQHDVSAVGAWRRDTFELTSSLDAEALVQFFLSRYRPTPVLAPWNGGSGFFSKDNKEAIGAVSTAKTNRLVEYQTSITAARACLESLKLTEKPTPETKEQLLTMCRNRLPDFALPWLDAAYVLGQDGAKYPPLLGTGGNDGRLEFTNNFMQRLLEVFDPTTGFPTADSERWLRRALFAEMVAAPGSKAPVGQFFPGAAGGANATAGFDAPSAVNPWDFILMIEGAVLFAAATVKRLESGETGQMVYPFCVRQAGVGYASATTSDEETARAEMWLPLWSQPTGLAELSAVFSEGRAQVGGRAARNGVDFTRAVVTLGVDRGLTAFQRYGFQVRNGLAYFATPLERVVVQPNARADLLADIDAWHDRLRRAAGDLTPASVARALRQIEMRMLDLCHHDDASHLQALLVALGQAERCLARSLRWTQEANLRPLGNLRPAWLRAANTGSVEFRLAVSLAGAARGALRIYLEPVTRKFGEWRWLENSCQDVRWSEADLPAVMNAIFARQLVSPPAEANSSLLGASLSGLTRFIEADLDDQLLTDLWWAFGLIDWDKVAPADFPPSPASSSAMIDTDGRPLDLDAIESRLVPSALFALLRLCFPQPGEFSEKIPATAAIHHRAASGDGAEASRLAVRRLRGSGFRPAIEAAPAIGPPAIRAAAALLFPLDARALAALRRSIFRPATQFA